LNISGIESEKIKERVKEKQKKFYSYIENKIDLKEDKSIEKLKNISNDILKIVEDIKKEEEEKKKNSENKEIIICNKFLLKNKNPEKVDIKIEPKTIDNSSKIKNISNEIEDINININVNNDWGKGIDDWPEKYSINSIIEFLGKCIVKIQMLPCLIKEAVKADNEGKIDKCTFILSDLFDIYKTIKENENSLISPILKDYKKSFESMFFKLKKSGVDFSKDE
jgi:hypothetical protein